MASRHVRSKKKLIEQLQQMPIVQVACQRAGVPRATYYRWCKEDESFADACHDALQSGTGLINDLAESKVIGGINEGKPVYVMAWLNNHHSSYGSKKPQRNNDLEERESIAEFNQLIRDLASTDDIFEPPDPPEEVNG